MNFLQKLLVNQLTSVYKNQLFRAMYQFFGQNVPVWIDDNPEAYIKQAYCGNGDVYAIVARIIVLGTRVPLKSQLLKNGRWEDYEEPELMKLIRNPNESQTYRDYLSAWLGFYCTTGNAYQYAPFLENGANKGKTKELFVMPSQATNILFGSTFEPVGGYTLSYSPNEIIAPENVCHTRTWNPDNQFYGLSPLRAASKNVTLANEAITTKVKSFHNQGPPGILSRDGEEFTEEQSQNLERRWSQKYTGSDNARKLVMTGAQMKWIQLGLSPVDLDIISSEKYNFGQLCNIYHMPVQMFNNTDASTDNNMAVAERTAYTHAVLPLLEMFAADLTSWLASRYNPNIRLVPDTSGIEVLQANRKEQAEWLEKAWWLKGTTKQRIMGEEEDEVMNDYFIPSNLIPLIGSEINSAEEAVKKLKAMGVQEYGQ